MEPASWQAAAAALFVGTAAGLVFWGVALVALAAGRLLRKKPSFRNELLPDAGARERRRYRQCEREQAVLLAALLNALLCCLLAWWLSPALPAGLPPWSLVAGLVLALGVLAGKVYLLIQLSRQRRQLRFTWAAKVAIGNVLKRLNLSGNRIFHDAVVEGTVIDHIVVGPKGVFSINVVARPAIAAKDTRPTAELRSGKLSLGGNVEALPVGDAARNMTLLTAALSKVVGHRVTVRSVLAVPGWHSTPNGGGNHLLLNENNLPMLTSWNTPDAYLMDEDCMAIQKYLQGTSLLRELD